MNDSEPRVGDADYRAICEFLNDEAELLAERDYPQWLSLLAEDIQYLVPVPEFFEHGTARSVGRGNAYFDDDYPSLKVRSELLSDPTLTTAENPPSLLCYFVSNIRPRCTADADEFAVTSNLLIYRIRASEPSPYLLAGKRHDLLRAVAGGYKLARREIRILQASIQGPNLSFIP